MIIVVTFSWTWGPVIRFMKEQSLAPDQQDRDVVPEREYQRVTISGEEKCGVSW